MITDQQRAAFAKVSRWPVEVAADYFDISPDDVCRILETPGATEVDRFDLEKRLVREELISLDWLALSFGVPRDALERAMRNPPSSRRLAPFQLDTYSSGGRFLLPLRIADAWVKALLPKHKTWSSLDGRARDLAACLDGRVRECAVSKRFGDTPPAVATCRCIVTWDDVSRAHQEYLENSKPISLEPDHVGWHALFDKKIGLSYLWRSDTTNLRSYLEQHGETWQAA